MNGMAAHIQVSRAAPAGSRDTTLAHGSGGAHPSLQGSAGLDRAAARTPPGCAAGRSRQAGAPSTTRPGRGRPAASVEHCHLVRAGLFHNPPCIAPPCPACGEVRLPAPPTPRRRRARRSRPPHGGGPRCAPSPSPSRPDTQPPLAPCPLDGQPTSSQAPRSSLLKRKRPAHALQCRVAQKGGRAGVQAKIPAGR